MFEFTRGGTKYTVKYGDGVSNNFLVLSFYDEDQGRNRWPVLRDTDDMGWKYENDEVEFLKDFVLAVNTVLDEWFGDLEEPTDDSTPRERLTYAVSTKLSFNEQTQHLEVK